MRKPILPTSRLIRNLPNGFGEINAGVTTSHLRQALEGLPTLKATPLQQIQPSTKDGAPVTIGTKPKK